MKLEVIKAGIIQAIADADLPLSDLEVHVEMAKGHIVARLTERCAHGAVEETVEHETEWERRPEEDGTHDWSPGVRARSKLEVFLWLLPKWLRYRKPRFERVTLATTVTNAYRKDVTLKKVTYLPRPDIRQPTNRATVGMGMTTDMVRRNLEEKFSILSEAMRETSPLMYHHNAEPRPINFGMGLPVHVSNNVPDDQVLIVSPKTFSLLRKQL